MMQNKWQLFVFGATMLVIAAPATVLSAQSAKDEKIIKNGSFVSLQYTLTGEDGKVIESNKGKPPLQYSHGTHQIIPGLEKSLTGMKVGEEKKVRVKPEDGYGAVDTKAFQELPKEKLPANGLKVGALLTGSGPQGQPVHARVHQIKEKTVVLDFNHPMAGKTLNFDVKVLDIQSAAPAQPAKPLHPAAPPQPAKPAEPAQPK